MQTVGQSKCIGKSKVAYLASSRLVISILCVALVVLVARPVSAHNFGEDFTLPLDSGDWTITGDPQVNGVLTLARAGDLEFIRTIATFSPGHYMEFDAIFSAGSSQNVGFSTSDWAQYFVISTWNGGNLSVATDDGPVQDLFELYAVVPTVYHHFTLDWRITDQFVLYVDGVQVYMDSVPFIGSMSAVAYNASNDNAYPVVVDNLVVNDGPFVTPTPTPTTTSTPTATPTGEVIVTVTPSPTPINAVTEQQAIALIYEEVRDVRLLLLIGLPVGLLMLIFAWLRVRQ